MDAPSGSSDLAALPLAAGAARAAALLVGANLGGAGEADRHAKRADLAALRAAEAAPRG